MSFRTRIHVALVIGLSSASFISVAACGSVQAVAQERVPPFARAGTIITADEISTTRAGTAYEAVERLRPMFLTSSRGVSAQANRGVYIDGVPVGGLTQLRTISAPLVREIRFLSAPEATARFGPGNAAGALLVTTMPSGDY